MWMEVMKDFLHFVLGNSNVMIFLLGSTLKRYCIADFVDGKINCIWKKKADEILK